MSMMNPMKNVKKNAMKNAMKNVIKHATKKTPRRLLLPRLPVPLLQAVALLVCGGLTASGMSQEAATPYYGLGTPASEADIAAWDIDIMPDGHGLPAGQGTVAAGEQVYRQKCLACHGEEGQGGPNDRLVMKFDPSVNFSLANTPKTIGNYWPYATSLYDYINRAMPHTEPGSLSADEVFGLTAYLLYLNDIIAEDIIMDARSLPQVEMPALPLFYWSEEVTP
jgi:S-disulfanyl-L-cysteine oxidoreductase SoxD